MAKRKAPARTALKKRKAKRAREGGVRNPWCVFVRRAGDRKLVEIACVPKKGNAKKLVRRLRTTRVGAQITIERRHNF